MKKKLFIFGLIAVLIFSLTGCGKKNINLNDYVIEQRNNLFVAEDSLYTVTLSSGLREKDYNLDGVKTEMMDFALLTIKRIDNNPMSLDNYSYIVKVNEESYNGNLERNMVDNTYSADLEISIPNDAKVDAQINFTGYSFNETMANISDEFKINNNQAVEIANKELKTEVNNLLSTNKTKIEVVTKILKDYSSSEVKNYYWYVGIVSTNGETLGILIDANTSEIIAKKA